MIIYEISMVNCNMLATNAFEVAKIKIQHITIQWDKQNVYGDFLQFPPITNTLLYSKMFNQSLHSQK